MTGEEWSVKAKGIINATGPFSDGLRKMDEPTTQEIVAPSSGVHIALPVSSIRYPFPISARLKAKPPPLPPRPTSDPRPWVSSTLLHPMAESSSSFPGRES